MKSSNLDMDEETFVVIATSGIWYGRNELSMDLLERTQKLKSTATPLYQRH